MRCIFFLRSYTVFDQEQYFVYFIGVEYVDIRDLSFVRCNDGSCFVCLSNRFEDSLVYFR